MLWSRPCGVWGHYNPGDLFVIDGLACVHDAEAFSMMALDPRTGNVLRHKWVSSLDRKTGDMVECRLPYDMPRAAPGALPDVAETVARASLEPKTPTADVDYAQAAAEILRSGDVSEDSCSDIGCGDGTRVSIHRDNLADRGYPRYFADPGPGTCRRFPAEASHIGHDVAFKIVPN